MILEHIMTRRVVTVDIDDTLQTVAARFEATAFHHLMVLERGKLCGVISDRDLLKATSPFVSTRAERVQDLETLQRKAHQIMSRKPITATCQTTIAEASHLLLMHNISCLPVLAAPGMVEGIVTWKDLLRSYLPAPEAPEQDIEP